MMYAIEMYFDKVKHEVSGMENKTACDIGGLQ